MPHWHTGRSFGIDLIPKSGDHVFISLLQSGRLADALIRYFSAKGNSKVWDVWRDNEYIDSLVFGTWRDWGEMELKAHVSVNLGKKTTPTDATSLISFCAFDVCNFHAEDLPKSAYFHVLVYYRLFKPLYITTEIHHLHSGSRISPTSSKSSSPAWNTTPPQTPFHPNDPYAQWTGSIHKEHNTRSQHQRRQSQTMRASERVWTRILPASWASCSKSPQTCPTHCHSPQHPSSRPLTPAGAKPVSYPSSPSLASERD